VENSGYFPYCLISIGAVIYWGGCNNNLNPLSDFLAGKIMIAGGILGLISDNSKKIKKDLESIGKSFTANFYSLKRRLSKPRELNYNSLKFSYMNR